MVRLNNLEFCQFLPTQANPTSRTQFHSVGKQAGRSEDKLIIVVIHYCHVRHVGRIAVETGVVCSNLLP